MKRLMLLILAVGLFLPSLLHAQAMRTWVSGTGADTNPCTLVAPCRTFAAAYANTPAGGEIVALNAGGFGPLTITHAITIDGGGQFAGVIVSSGDAFTINAGVLDTVVLRNLSIDGYSQRGAHGIYFIGGGNLIVEHCTVHDFYYVGIDFLPSSASSVLVVKDTTINGNSSGRGISVAYPGSAALDNVRLNNNGVGLDTDTQTDVRNSVAEGNGYGFESSEGDLNLVHCVAANNTEYGLYLANRGIMRLSDVRVSHNGTALYGESGTIAYTYGDNEVDGNGNNSFPVVSGSKH
jgi:hypothetical protein